MTTRVSSKGQIVLPSEIRNLDAIRSGEEFNVERVDEGTYLLRRVARANTGVVDLLLSCPAKDWFVAADRTESTRDFELGGFE